MIKYVKCIWEGHSGKLEKNEIYKVLKEDTNDYLIKTPDGRVYYSEKRCFED